MTTPPFTDLAPFTDPACINPSLVLSEATALDVLAQQTGWQLAGHEYGAVLRGPTVADCTDLAIDAVRALEQHGWEMPWQHWHDEHGGIEPNHGPVVLLSLGVATAQRVISDLAAALLRQLIGSINETCLSEHTTQGRTDRITYRRRQLARRRRNRR
jgi:hypothetical protein